MLISTWTFNGIIFVFRLKILYFIHYKQILMYLNTLFTTQRPATNNNIDKTDLSLYEPVQNIDHTTILLLREQTTNIYEYRSIFHFKRWFCPLLTKKVKTRWCYRLPVSAYISIVDETGHRSFKWPKTIRNYEVVFNDFSNTRFPLVSQR